MSLSRYPRVRAFKFGGDKVITPVLRGKKNVYHGCQCNDLQEVRVGRVAGGGQRVIEKFSHLMFQKHHGNEALRRCLLLFAKKRNFFFH